jgi:hypothetical protein
MRLPLVLAASLLAGLVPLQAQEGRRSGPDTNPYLVEYRLRDTADVATDRRYTVMINGEHKGALRMGSRTPAVSGSFSPVSANSLVNTQYTYLDVGINIECTVKELDARVQLHSALDLSSLDKDPAPANAAAHNPTIKQTKLELDTTLQLGKPTILASITDPATNHLLQITATVTAAN